MRRAIVVGVKGSPKRNSNSEENVNLPTAITELEAVCRAFLARDTFNNGEDSEKQLRQQLRGIEIAAKRARVRIPKEK